MAQNRWTSRALGNRTFRAAQVAVIAYIICRLRAKVLVSHSTGTQNGRV